MRHSHATPVQKVILPCRAGELPPVPEGAGPTAFWRGRNREVLLGPLRMLDCCIFSILTQACLSYSHQSHPPELHA